MRKGGSRILLCIRIKMDPQHSVQNIRFLIFLRSTADNFTGALLSISLSFPVESCNNEVMEWLMAAGVLLLISSFIEVNCKLHYRLPHIDSCIYLMQNTDNHLSNLLVFWLSCLITLYLIKKKEGPYEYLAETILPFYLLEEKSMHMKGLQMLF